ncbi:MAG TPA: hypothetical protein VID04_04905 [Methylomirabilota bacterium]|jgi:hypothetical protein
MKRKLKRKPTRANTVRAVRRRKKGAIRPRRLESERRLLRLASELTALGRAGRPPRDTLADALACFSAGLAEPAQPARRADKARRLALAWAREQVRLAFTEVLERATAAGAVRRDVPSGMLAWLVLAACEALAQEAPDAVPDRLAALAAFIRRGDPPV